jgi:HK97 family phage major capsid protein
VWVNSLMPGQPDMLLGHPVIECEQMPDIATDSLSIAFGNFKKGYTIIRRLGVRFLLDPYTAKPYIKLYTFTRVGGAVNNFEAVKLLKFSA